MPPTKSVLMIISLILSNVQFTSASIEPNQGEEVIIYGLPFDFDEYSIYTAKTYQSKQWMEGVYSGLIKRSSGIFLPWTADLAKSMPTVSTDGLSYTFELRENLLFSNGDLLTVDDVEFSLKVALTPAINIVSYSMYSGFLDNTSITILTDHSFTVTLKSPYAYPYELLSFPLVPEEFFGDRYENCLNGVLVDCKWNAQDGADTVSIGPYMVTDIDNRNQIVTIEANPNWYDPTNVKTDKIIYQKISEKNAAISALTEGSIHIFDANYYSGLNDLKEIDGVTESYVTVPVSHELFLNHQHPWFGTGEQINAMNGITFNNHTAAKLLRKAISHVVDRNTFVTELLEGLAQSAATSVSPTTFGYDSTLQADEFNIDIAKEIMVELGFDYNTLEKPDNSSLYSTYFFETVIQYPSWYGNWEDLVRNFADQLKKIGIGLFSVPLSSASEINYILNSNNNAQIYDYGGFDIILYKNEWGLDWNPLGHYDGSGSCQTGSCQNFYNFDLDENISPIANTVNEYLMEMDFDDRLEIVASLQVMLKEWLPTIPILYPVYHWGWSSDVTGLDMVLISSAQSEWDLIYRTGFEYNAQGVCSCEPTVDSSGTLLFVFLTLVGIVGFPLSIPSIMKRIRKLRKKDVSPEARIESQNEEILNVSLLCIACGKANMGGSNYCQDCGTRLRG